MLKGDPKGKDQAPVGPVTVQPSQIKNQQQESDTIGKAAGDLGQPLLLNRGLNSHIQQAKNQQQLGQGTAQQQPGIQSLLHTRHHQAEGHGPLQTPHHRAERIEIEIIIVAVIAETLQGGGRHQGQQRQHSPNEQEPRQPAAPIPWASGGLVPAASHQLRQLHQPGGNADRQVPDKRVMAEGRQQHPHCQTNPGGLG